MDVQRVDEMTERMVALALEMGATAAASMDTDALVVSPDLVAYCGQGCPSFGTSGNCPPHGPSAREFQLSLPWYKKAVVFKFDLPISVLMTDERHATSRKIHEVSAILERFAKHSGASLTMGVATGGCNLLFCRGFDSCARLEGDLCRHQGLAKPSMSGLGVNFTALCNTLGWPVQKITAESEASQDEIGSLAGFVLVG